jgi:FkbM family methyltransferase
MATESSFVTINRFTYEYTDSHDILGIIETSILDIYKSRNIRAGVTVVDIGAGIGDFAVMASHRVGVAGRVVAIEPDDQDYEFLLRNLESNRCRNVIPVHAGVSDKEEELVFRFKGRTTHCRARRLQNLLREVGVDSQSVKFVKIDIEGGERAVIPDNLPLLTHCDRVVAELHNGADLVLNPLMDRAGLKFRRIANRDCLTATLSFILRHPFQSVRVYRAARRAEGFHGAWKLVKGLDISVSSELVVGEYAPIPS